MRGKSSEKKFLLLVLILVSQQNPDCFAKESGPTFLLNLCCVFYKSEEAERNRGACSARGGSQEEHINFNPSQAFHPGEEEGEAFTVAGMEKSLV